ncbi:MAG: AbrB/MazE/SpoVT family DNA-binding domain-containing protein [Acidobacteriota bacterium]
MTTTISSKGQITIPKEIRDQLNLTEGTKFAIRVVNGRIELIPKNVSVWSLMGSLKSRLDRPVTIEEMDEGIAEFLREDHERIRKGLKGS